MFPEFRCYPVWVLGSNGLWNDTDPTELPVSASLAAELMRWSDRFDSIFAAGASSSVGFATMREDEEFSQWGASLARRLQEELGADYSVAYEYEPG